MSEEIKRNCNTCKFSMFRVCETLKNNEEYQNIKDDGFIERHEFKANFIFDKYKSIYIEYPIEVSKISRDTEIHSFMKRDIGKFVSIRPCADEYKDETYLGLFLGDLPIGHRVSHNPDTKELSISFNCNPAIFVFDLNKIIYGCESWWGIVENEDDLRRIADKDIENVWYVKALKQLYKNVKEGKEDVQTDI